MKDLLITIFQYSLPTLITAGFLFLTSLLANKKSKSKDDADVQKTKAEIEAIENQDEINWIAFYKQEIKDLRAEFNERFNEMKKEKDLLIVANKEKDKSIAVLEGKVAMMTAQIESLEIDLAKTKNQSSPEHVAEVFHQKVDEGVEQITNNK